jgi:signal transduction histidine kinase
MSMVFNIIAAAAVINTVLGVLALTKGRSRLNLSFFFISILLALWNFFVVLWAGANITVFSRLNFIVISLIPPAGMFFVTSLFRLDKGPMSYAAQAILVPAAAVVVYTLSTFFSGPMLAWYDSRWCKIMIFIYEFTALLFVFIVLIYNYGRIKFKQEKIKIRYVIIAFLILYAGGMLDLSSGAGLHHIPVKWAGNICNVIYAAIIFYVIFKMRLFNVAIVFKNFVAYTAIALVVGGAYIITARLLINEFKALGAVYFILTILVVYYAGRMHQYVVLFAEKVGGLSNVEEARRAYQRVIAAHAAEEEKIKNTLLIFKDNLEMNTAVFVRGGDYYTAAWETPGGGFKKLIEGPAMPAGIIIRYETENKRELELLARFGADMIMPLVYGQDMIGVFAGKKQTADISFTQDEVDLVFDLAAATAIYMKTITMQKQQVEDENMKRLGMMARQMAHEIKNPLAALWGAAQLIEGRSGADRGNIEIIKEEMKRLTNILDSWQDFSREMKVEKQPQDFERLLGEVLKVINMQANKAGIEFSRPAEKTMVSVDPEKIRQVFINVILNSLDALAGRDEQKIGIYTVKKKDFLDLKIRDNGSGIKKEDLARVKEPLFTSKPKGSGLGLAISERIMKAHGGALLIESDGESYTEVTLSIPLA